MERRYDDITIADILERANVGKSTFYEHFKNKEDVLRSAMSGMLETLADTVSENYDPDRLRGLIAHFWKNRRLGRKVFSGSLGDNLRRSLTALIEGKLMAAGSAKAAAQLKAIQLASAHIHLLEAWTAGEVAAEQEDIVYSLHRIAAGA